MGLSGIFVHPTGHTLSLDSQENSTGEEIISGGNCGLVTLVREGGIIGLRVAIVS